MTKSGFSRGNKYGYTFRAKTDEEEVGLFFCRKTLDDLTIDGDYSMLLIMHL